MRVVSVGQAIHLYVCDFVSNQACILALSIFTKCRLLIFYTVMTL